MIELIRRNFLTILIFLVVFDVFVWFQIAYGGKNENLEIYFLNVGQGDGELVNLAGGVQVLIDGGPDKKVLDELAKVLAPTDRYIDLIVLSHPQYDHFAGLIEVLKRYKIGAFIYNGRDGTARAFEDLKKAVKESGTPAVVLRQRDKIKYFGNEFDVLSPTKEFLASEELNDTTLVLKLNSGNFRALFTGDIGFNVENYLVENFDIKSDVLKVGHHCSRFSSGEEFLKNVNPKIAAIEVGKNNYGHPTAAALNRLISSGARIFRTDKDGTIKIEVDGDKINIFKTR